MSDRRLTPELLLAAYASGIFPMAEARDDPEVYWVDPRQRGIIPLDAFHVSRSLARRLRKTDYEIGFDIDIAGVVAGCAARDETWINATIRDLTLELARRGHAHSCEVRIGGRLVGGVYGVALGGAFFGESMFSSVPDASKIALAWLVDHLKRAGFVLFDTQFITPHLRRLGAVEIPRAEYRRLLAEALDIETDFGAAPAVTDRQALVQRMTQTS